MPGRRCCADFANSGSCVIQMLSAPSVSWTIPYMKTRADHLPKNSAADRQQILLVEDERELREVLALGLRRARYTVDVAATATEARQLIAAQSYALVIA